RPSPSTSRSRCRRSRPTSPRRPELSPTPRSPPMPRHDRRFRPDLARLEARAVPAGPAGADPPPPPPPDVHPDGTRGYDPSTDQELIDDEQLYEQLVSASNPDVGVDIPAMIDESYQDLVLRIDALRDVFNQAVTAKRAVLSNDYATANLKISVLNNEINDLT